MGIHTCRAPARTLFGLAVAAMAIAAGPAAAKELTSPYGAFIEGGISDDSRSVVAGIAWTWVQPSKWGAGNASGYLETSIGEWACHRESGQRYRHCSTQIGLTPVIRYEPSWWEHWYTDRREFATQFNFGDHIGLGRKFGADGRDEIELRAEHYSNGGYKKPNPGENWFQLRYMHWF